MKLIIPVFLFLIETKVSSNECQSTLTTVSGWRSPQTLCAGDLVFEENFDELDCSVWHHRVTLSGGRISE
jgi:hypothetical protein